MRNSTHPYVSYIDEIRVVGALNAFVDINSANGATTRWVLIAVVVVGLLIAAWFIRGILLLTLASVILVVLFTMPIRFFMRLGVPRSLAALLSLLLITFSIIILVLAALPTLVQQFTTLATVIIPQGIRRLSISGRAARLSNSIHFSNSSS